MDLDAALRDVSVQARRIADRAAEDARRARSEAAGYQPDSPNANVRDAWWRSTKRAEEAETLAERWSVRAQAAAEGKIAVSQHNDTEWATMTWNLQPAAHDQDRIFIYIEACGGED